MDEQFQQISYISWSDWQYHSKSHTVVLTLNFHRKQSFLQNCISVLCLMQHFKWVTHCLFYSWNLASFSFHQRIYIRHHILSGSQFQDVIQVLVRDSWAQLCFITEKTCSQRYMVPNMHNTFAARAVKLE